MQRSQNCATGYFGSNFLIKHFIGIYNFATKYILSGKFNKLIKHSNFSFKQPVGAFSTCLAFP